VKQKRNAIRIAREEEAAAIARTEEEKAAQEAAQIAATELELARLVAEDEEMFGQTDGSGIGKLSP
jgi:hypothetical protein